jgi:hypothetical protein
MFGIFSLKVRSICFVLGHEQYIMFTFTIDMAFLHGHETITAAGKELERVSRVRDDLGC